VSYIARVIINDSSTQISVKRIRLYIKTKRKIHDNVGLKKHSNISLQPHSLFVKLPQILTPPSPPTATLLHPATRALADVKKADVNCIASKYICNIIVYFDLLNSNVDKNHAIDRYFYVQRVNFIYSFSSAEFRSVFRSWPLLSRNFQESDTAHAIGSSVRVTRR
jgi:hypothetical protein